MIYLLETTKWTDNTPNHIYVFSDKKTSKVSGYIKNGTEEIVMFNKPMPFDKRKRTFKEIKV
jgi:hypothetical protein